MARHAAGVFRTHEIAALHELTDRRDDQETYLGEARSRIRELEDILLADVEDRGEERDMGWDVETLRADFGTQVAREPAETME